jgi:hypothetical protein
MARGGHRWETTSDIAGSITACARCGKLSHAGIEGPDDGDSSSLHGGSGSSGS